MSQVNSYHKYDRGEDTQWPYCENKAIPEASGLTEILPGYRLAKEFQRGREIGQEIVCNVFLLNHVGGKSNANNMSNLSNGSRTSETSEMSRTSKTRRSKGSKKRRKGRKTTE